MATTERVQIGYIGDVHSGTLECECGWEQFVRNYEADDVERQHRLVDHSEPADQLPEHLRVEE